MAIVVVRFFEFIPTPYLSCGKLSGILKHMHTLTKRQKEILDYIARYIKKHGYSPTYEEIRTYFSLSAFSTVFEHLTALIHKGYLKRDENKERGLYLPEKRSPFISIPLVGTIACGSPLEAIEEPNKYIEIRREASLRGNIYALKAKGNSMIQEGIFEGDIIILKKQNSADNGDTVVAVIDDNEATLKKYFQEKDRIRLQPANPEFKPLYRKKIEIRGKVVKIIRNLS